MKERSKQRRSETQGLSQTSSLDFPIVLACEWLIFCFNIILKINVTIDFIDSLGKLQPMGLLRSNKIRKGFILTQKIIWENELSSSHSALQTNSIHGLTWKQRSHRDRNNMTFLKELPSNTVAPASGSNIGRTVWAGRRHSAGKFCTVILAFVSWSSI